ncbi:multidrug ABC transporter ATP-binding protein [Couchioplanes caeruleus subsp. caeruleus]|uniref:Multidrug ABC transporter ATP-binding protein n=2 Tax=Couchioplanes caeruleus TaxID=56438 RepID=A0A1K0GF25_9ACTN|nr:multidrug ABC transporter ATP-binding protein [Couchioplanes caeruleus subsp. caeruleus]
MDRRWSVHAATRSRRGLLTRTIAGHWRLVAGGAVLAAGHQAGEAAVPVIIGIVIDEAISTGRPAELVWWLTLLAAVIAALSLCFRYSLRMEERAAFEGAHGLRVALAARVLDPAGGAEHGRLAGALTSTATGDAQRAGDVNLALPRAAAAVFGLLVAAVALLRISVPLGLLVLLGSPVLLLLAHLLCRPLERRSHVEQERAAEASGIAADLIAGVRSLKGIGAEATAADRYRRTSRESMAAAVRAAGAQARLDGAMLAVNGVFLAAIALVGGRLAAHGEISVGELVTAVGLAQFLVWPLSLFSWVNGQLAQARASAARIAAVLTAPPAVPLGGATLPRPVRGRLRLRGVTHAGLSAIDLDVAPGELLGVVTTEPAEATALLQCLTRDADPAAGSVQLDGNPLSGLDPDDVRATLLVAAHDAELFADSLLDNVAAAASTPQTLERALAATGMHELADALPDGLDTAVSERGRSLSGGQRQRATLARALAADPPVLVLHDPTTAVDAVTEAALATGIRQTRQGRTTLLVTTSPALLSATDRVVFVHGGTVAAAGSHGDLLRAHPRYRAAVLT